MSRHGTILTYSVVHSGTDEFKDKTPYVVALVKENQQIRLARVEGYDDQTYVTVGMEVAYTADDERNNPVYRFL